MKKIVRCFQFVLAVFLLIIALLFLATGFVGIKQRNVPAAVIAWILAIALFISAYLMLIMRKKFSPPQQFSKKKIIKEPTKSVPTKLPHLDTEALKLKKELQTEKSIINSPMIPELTEVSLENSKKEETFIEYLKRTRSPERIEEIKTIQAKKRKEEEQEDFLRIIRGEELKWKREQLHGGNGEDIQE